MTRAPTRRGTATIPPAALSPGRADLRLVGPRNCGDCGVSLNVIPVGNDLDAYTAQDRVRAGDRLKVGHVTLCRVCAFDNAKSMARFRRVKRTPNGNFLD